jgi:hypothetical protein
VPLDSKPSTEHRDRDRELGHAREQDDVRDRVKARDPEHSETDRRGCPERQIEDRRRLGPLVLA